VWGGFGGWVGGGGGGSLGSKGNLRMRMGNVCSLEEVSLVGLIMRIQNILLSGKTSDCRDGSYRDESREGFIWIKYAWCLKEFSGRDLRGKKKSEIGQQWEKRAKLKERNAMAEQILVVKDQASGINPLNNTTGCGSG